MDINNKLLLKEKEAAELLSMSTHFLRRDRISENSVGVPFIRIGGAIRYRLEELETWILEKSKISHQKPGPQSVHPAGSQINKKRGRPRKS